MMNPQSKLSSSSRETREGDILSVPTLQNQGTDRVLSPPLTPEQIQHDLFWCETVLHWNRSNYRWSLIEYIPCLMGIIWEEDRMGRIENLTSFPFEAQHFFVKDIDAQRLMSSNLSYHRLFRTKIGCHENYSGRRMSEPELEGSRLSDPQGITQESFLFGRFLKFVLKTTKISCTVLILSLKFAQLYLRRIKSIKGMDCDQLNCNQFRLFVTSLILADKYSEDHPYTNKSWSSLSGLPIEEINSMERSFLKTMQHELFIPEAEFRNWTKALQNLCQWSTPNHHHPDNSRKFTIAYSSTSTRRMSFSNVTGIISSDLSDNIESSKNGNHQISEKVSFWNRFKFHRK